MDQNSAEYYLLDVFTDKKFGGNQLAIFPDATRIPESQMQTIARELNLSETVFLFPKNESGRHPMRIFTPTSELPTAGHPTIGTAYLLSKMGNHTESSISILLDQKVGPIDVAVELTNGKPSMATMYQVLPTFGQVYERRADIAELLGLQEADLLDNPIQQVSCGVPYVIVPLQTIEAMKEIRFNSAKWEELRTYLADQAIYAFAQGGVLPGSHLHGRMFAPEIGIVEDPATGSANGPLACYLSHHGIMSGPLISEQGFEMGRPSILNIEAVTNGDQITQVKVGGQAVFIGKGLLYLH